MMPAGLRTKERASAAAAPTLPAAPAPAALGAGQAARAVQRGSSSGQIVRTLFIAASLCALAAGWIVAGRRSFTPEEGVGYWLGIVGGSLLLAQLLYPLRKRASFTRRLGSAPAWFRMHMVLGIVAPILILWHCNFSLGDTNSTVTLFVMLIVAASGIVGRYLYGQLHRGLYGARLTVQDLLAGQAALLRDVEADAGSGNGVIAAGMTRYAERVLAPRRPLFAATWRAISTSVTAPLQRHRLERAVKSTITANAPRLGWSAADQRAHMCAARRNIGLYVQATTRAANLAFYDRLFGLWHLLHMPLFCLLVVTGFVHVVAVHLY